MRDDSVEIFVIFIFIITGLSCAFLFGILLMLKEILEVLQ